jgi:hypothetical protein
LPITINIWFIFGGDAFYPRGGMHDFINSFDTCKECIDYVKNFPKHDSKYDWIYAYNMDTDEIIDLDSYQIKKKQKE